MATYNFYQWVSESGSLIYSGSFVDDPTAIAYLSNLPGGYTYSIDRVNVVSSSLSYTTCIYGVD